MKGSESATATEFDFDVAYLNEQLNKQKRPPRVAVLAVFAISVTFTLTFAVLSVEAVGNASTLDRSVAAFVVFLGGSILIGTKLPESLRHARKGASSVRITDAGLVLEYPSGRRDTLRWSHADLQFDLYDFTGVPASAMAVDGLRYSIWVRGVVSAIPEAAFQAILARVDRFKLQTSNFSRRWGLSPRAPSPVVWRIKAGHSNAGDRRTP
jgi:hypothetical protein